MFTSLLNRTTHPQGWQKIPWDDPDFSRRMLAEHLDQTHDHASRRLRVVDQQVEWIHHKILHDSPAVILDLGCGPGLYAGRLTAHGHVCTGFDFSPASIDYAREHNPAHAYLLGDIRTLDFGQDYDLVMCIYGELNAFAPEDAAHIVRKAFDALKPGGKLLLEVHPAAVIYAIGHEPPSWYTAEKGLFADSPYLCLTESLYQDDHAITHHYVYAADTGAMQHYVNMLHCYTDDEYRQLLGAFKQVMFYPALTGDLQTGNLFVIVAEK